MRACGRVTVQTIDAGSADKRLAETEYERYGLAIMPFFLPVNNYKA